MKRPDKRYSARLKATAGDYVVYVEGAGKVRDISQTGVFIETRFPFPEGTVFGFTLTLGTQMLSVKGVVRRCIPQTGMGVRFHDISVDTRNRLERVLNNLRTQAGKG